MTPTLQQDIDTVIELLRSIAERPDLPNPYHDADWKNCQKWSSHDAKQALPAAMRIKDSYAPEVKTMTVMEVVKIIQNNTIRIVAWDYGHPCTIDEESGTIVLEDKTKPVQLRSITTRGIDDDMAQAIAHAIAKLGTIKVVEGV